MGVSKCSLEARINAESVVESLLKDRNSAREIGCRGGTIDGLLKLFEEDLYPQAFKASLMALLPLCTVLKNKMNCSSFD